MKSSTVEGRVLTKAAKINQDKTIVKSRNDRMMGVADVWRFAGLQRESWQKQASISKPRGPSVFGHLLLLMGSVPKLLFSTPVPQKEEV